MEPFAIYSQRRAVKLSTFLCSLYISFLKLLGPTDGTIAKYKRRRENKNWSANFLKMLPFLLIDIYCIITNSIHQQGGEQARVEFLKVEI